MSWNITGCNKQCKGCNVQFQDGHIYHCHLSLGVDGPIREDYCQECWDKFNLESSEKISYWQGKFKSKTVVVKEEPIKESASKRLLKKWLNSPERLHQCFCYILALMLQRKKIFQPQPPLKEPGNKDKLVYEDKETGETYILDNPELTLSELEHIELQLKEMLQQELSEKEEVLEEKQEDRVN